MLQKALPNGTAAIADSTAFGSFTGLNPVSSCIAPNGHTPAQKTLPNKSVNINGIMKKRRAVRGIL